MLYFVLVVLFPVRSLYAAIPRQASYNSPCRFSLRCIADRILANAPAFNWTSSTEKPVRVEQYQL